MLGDNGSLFASSHPISDASVKRRMKRLSFCNHHIQNQDAGLGINGSRGVTVIPASRIEMLENPALWSTKSKDVSENDSSCVQSMYRYRVAIEEFAFGTWQTNKPPGFNVWRTALRKESCW